MLLSYPASIHLGIMEFKVPNEASSHTLVNSIMNNPDVKQVSFINPLHYSVTAKKNTNHKASMEVTPEVKTSPEQCISRP